MWQNFTERTRRIIYHAQQEAHRYGHPNVGTEHLLLGICDEPTCTAARVLDTLAGGIEKVRVATVAALPPGAGGLPANIGLTQGARTALDAAQKDGAQTSPASVDSEHLLLGLLQTADGGAAHTLNALGVTVESTRRALQAEHGDPAAAPQGQVKETGNFSETSLLPPMVRNDIGPSWDHMGTRARAAVEAALAEAAHLGDTAVTPEHLLLGALKDNESGAARVLARLNVPIAALRGELSNGLPRHGDPRAVDNKMELRATTRDILSQAELAARTDGDGQINTNRILMGILAHPETAAATLLVNKGVDLGTLRVLARELTDERAGQSNVDMSQMANLTLAQLIVRSQMKGANLLRISDLSASEVAIIFAATGKLKSRQSRANVQDETAAMLRGKTLAMVFQKPSLRTRVTFEIGMTQLGGHAIHLGPDEIGVGERESPADVARNLERWVHGIAARTFQHSLVEELAKNSGIPVINGLSDLEHPCQALADFYTLRERFGSLAGLTLAYVGDSNNVARSLAELAARTGVHLRIGSPQGYGFEHTYLKGVSDLASSNGGSIATTTDAKAAADGADAVYADVWASMGQEAEAEKRHRDFAGFLLGGDVLAAAKPAAVVMHCQPAHRGEEISAEAMDSPNSVIFDQAENRLHVQKALLALML